MIIYVYSASLGTFPRSKLYSIGLTRILSRPAYNCCLTHWYITISVMVFILSNWPWTLYNCSMTYMGLICFQLLLLYILFSSTWSFFCAWIVTVHFISSLSFSHFKIYTLSSVKIYICSEKKIIWKVYLITCQMPHKELIREQGFKLGSNMSQNVPLYCTLRLCNSY